MMARPMVCRSPTFRGAHAAADSWEEIPRAVGEALDLWFEDADELVPSSFGRSVRPS